MKFRGLDLQRRFVVAAGFLGAFGLFWPLAVWALDWTMTKIPVAWPDGVTVSPDFRLTSLPASFGHYRLAEGDLPGGLHLEHGERVMDEDERKILEVGTYIDAGRRSSRSSNWYVNRYYEDTRQSKDSPLRFWCLHVVYYTGTSETVPHIPARCMTVAGATQAEAEVTMPFRVTDLGQPWKDHLSVQRPCFRWQGHEGLVVQYYTFLVNGLNEPDWRMVRWHLASSITEKHCFYAKIQFEPWRPVLNVTDGDHAAQEFLNAFLPEVLRALPTHEHIVKLNSGRMGDR